MVASLEMESLFRDAPFGRSVRQAMDSPAPNKINKVGCFNGKLEGAALPQSVELKIAET